MSLMQNKHFWSGPLGISDGPVTGISTDFQYGDYGYLPGVAQAAQGTPTPAPELNPQPVFSRTQLAHANWFTTRVHLSPLGKAMLP